MAEMDIRKIMERLHIQALSEMQQETADRILHTEGDVVLLSPTGSGKTLAYLLPLVQLIDTASSEVQALVISPGRELALQSDGVLKSMGTDVRSASCYGGRAAMDEHRVLRRLQPHVIFGTPGRLNDHIRKENISTRHIRYLVIDEFDKCLEMGFHQEMERLVKSLPALRRRILLSATEAEAIPHFIRLERQNYIVHQGVQPPEGRIALMAVRSGQKDKLETLRRLLCHLGDSSSIVFLNYRDSVERVAGYLRQQGFAASAFHGGMDQKQREDALYKFSNGSANIFVSTDLASRGLDIPAIGHIIHYHLPQGEDEYTHRVGRTARWNETGDAFFLLGPEEQVPDYVKEAVCDYDLPAEVPPPAVPRMATLYIGKGKKDKLSKGDIVGFLCKKGGLTAGDIGRIDVKERYTYVAVSREKLRQVVELSQGEKIKGIRTVVEPVR